MMYNAVKNIFQISEKAVIRTIIYYSYWSLDKGLGMGLPVQSLKVKFVSIGIFKEYSCFYNYN